MKLSSITSLFSFILACGIQCSQAVQSQSAPSPVLQFEASDAVLRGVVTTRQYLKDDLGRIETRYTIQVLESLKGKLPAVLSIFLPGGTADGEIVCHGCQPSLRLGEERLFYLKRGRGGHLGLNPESAGAVTIGKASGALAEARRLSLSSQSAVVDLTDQAAPEGMLSTVESSAVSTATTNLYTDGTYGLPWRWIGPDRGDPIPYLVDADHLPTGISLSTALTAISNALTAWSAVASVRFQFEGIVSFGMNAADINLSDRRLRIQLHNSYGEITSASTLGVGGNRASLSVLPNGWTTGGSVFGHDFHHTTSGYVVLNHTSASMQNALTFEEVLCHEVGHALSMRHSSEDANEPTLSPAYQAIMYFQVHADGRGAAPGAWDINVIQQTHPVLNSPPYSFNRMMDITTAAEAPAVPGINEILLTGDLQSTSLTAELYDASLTGNGTFAVTSNLLRYTPAGFWGETTRNDPAGNSSRGSVYYRLSDGSHASPWARVRVLSFSPDTKPASGIDGIPDNWMLAHFGDSDPAAGAGRAANEDYDADTLTNLEEYRSWMDPTQAPSAQRLTASSDGTVSWQGKAYELYELWGTTNMSNWFFVRTLSPTNDTPQVTLNPKDLGFVAYRALKVR